MRQIAALTIWETIHRNLPEPGMPFGRATWGQTAASDRDASDEARVRREFWAKAKRVAAQLPFAEDLLAAYYCAFDQATPLHVKAALVGALAYFVMPFDVMPDVLPMLGYTDDAAVLVAALRLVSGHMLPEHRDAARMALARIRGQS